MSDQDYGCDEDEKESYWEGGAASRDDEVAALVAERDRLYEGWLLRGSQRNRLVEEKLALEAEHGRLIQALERIARPGCMMRIEACGYCQACIARAALTTEEQGPPRR